MRPRRCSLSTRWCETAIDLNLLRKLDARSSASESPANLSCRNPKSQKIFDRSSVKYATAEGKQPWLNTKTVALIVTWGCQSISSASSSPPPLSIGTGESSSMTTRLWLLTLDATLSCQARIRRVTSSNWFIWIWIQCKARQVTSHNNTNMPLVSQYQHAFLESVGWF